MVPFLRLGGSEPVWYCRDRSALPVFEPHGRYDGLAVLDLHALARLFGRRGAEALKRLARVNRDLDVRAVADVLVRDAARDHGHLAFLDGDRPGLRVERAAALVLEGPLVGAEIAVPAALLAVAVGDLDDDVLVGVEDERQVAVLHVDAGDHAFLEDVVERDLLHLAPALRALLQVVLVALDDEALLGTVAPVGDRRAPVRDELLDLLAHGQSALMLAALMAAAYLGNSRLIRAAASSGVVPSGSLPSCTRRSCTSGALSAFATSALTRSTMARGVAAGTAMPIQMCSLNPGTPASMAVGQSGKFGLRFSLVTASAFALPPFTKFTAEPRLSSAKFTSPVDTAVDAGAPPLYGTCRNWTFACCAIISVSTWLVDPVPAVEKVRTPGFAFAAASSSATEWYGLAGGTTSSIGLSTMIETGARSFSGS